MQVIPVSRVAGGIMSARALFELNSGARDLSVAEFGELAFGIIRDVLPVHAGMFGHGTYDARGDVTIDSLHRYEVHVDPTSCCS